MIFSKLIKKNEFLLKEINLELRFKIERFLIENQILMYKNLSRSTDFKMLNDRKVLEYRLK